MKSNFMIWLTGVAIMMCASAGTGEPVIEVEEFIYSGAPFLFAHTSTLLEPEPGIVLASSVGGPAGRDPGNGIWLARREDGKWGAPVEIAQLEVAAWNPVLWRDAASGEVLLFYKAGVSPESWTGLLRRSGDGGRTWSEPETLPAGLTGPVRAKPLQLGDGTLVCGDSVEAWQAWSCYVNLTPDLGKTWKRVGPISWPGEAHGIIQPVIFWADEAKTTLRMLVRATEKIGRLGTAISKDNGQSWSAVEPTGVINPNSAVDAVRMTDGRVALVHNPTARGRHLLSLSFSNDGGETWERALDLKKGKEGEEYSYPAIIQTADGRLMVSYTWKKENIRFLEIRTE